MVCYGRRRRQPYDRPRQTDGLVLVWWWLVVAASAKPGPWLSADWAPVQRPHGRPRAPIIRGG